MRARKLCSFLAGAAVALFVPATAASAAAPHATTLEKVSSVVQPGIVYLETTFSGIVIDPVRGVVVGNRPFGIGARCTGFFVNPDGYIATAGHCVEIDDEVKPAIISEAAAWQFKKLTGAPPQGALWRRFHAQAQLLWRVRSAESRESRRPDRSVEAAYGVGLSGLPSGRSLPARVLGLRKFEKGDVALVKVEAEDVPVLELAPEADVEVGTAVVSVGYPASVDYVADPTFDPSFKDGSVSSKKTIGDGLVEVYEISAAVSNGMSGGPTVDLRGKVIGVNSFGITGEPQAFKFVAPAKELEQLMNDKGVENELGQIDRTYRAGLAAYYRGDREESLAKLDDVLGLAQEHEFAQEFRSKALRLPEAEEGGGISTPLLILLIVVGLAAVAAATWFLRRRRGGGREHAAATPASPGGPARAVEATGPALVLRNGDRGPDRVPITREVVIGRGKVDLTLDDPEVSRRHAVVRPRDGCLEIEDLGSANGTSVNGASIHRPKMLEGGDVVRLGDTLIDVDVPTAGKTQRRPRGADRIVSLVITEGPLAGTRITVESEMIVGRAGADITIQDPEISRRHASLKPQNGGLEIRDLESANGTVVNGAAIDRPTTVRNGDVITLGHTSITVEATGSAADTRGTRTVYHEGADRG